MKMKNGLKLPVTMKEYEATKVKHMANLDVYRSAPDEQNRLHDFSCLTIMIRHNTDLRNYLIIEAGNNLNVVPAEILQSRGPFELWKENEDSRRVFYYFDMLFSETKRLEGLKQKSYTLSLNSMARQWEEYDEHEKNMEKYFQRSEQEKQECKKELKETAREVLKYLKEEKKNRRKEKLGTFMRKLIGR